MQIETNQTFLRDVLDGLSAPQKRLSSKYFYDATGDQIFQQIMHCPEYYLTRCELQILKDHADKIARQLSNEYAEYDVIELGAGDASKSVHLLRSIKAHNGNVTYFPIDISTHVIDELEERLPREIPGMKVQGLNGEYLPMLEKAMELSMRPKLVLFMGANIGNMHPSEALDFCKELRAYLNPGDRLLIGFDLVKSPHKILAAYNDAAGYTRDFNLNVLHRINRELEGDFNVNAFEHFPVYDPISGACKSYLVSTRAQEVHIGETTFSFEKAEPIYTEISQKYSLQQIDEMADLAGFKPAQHYLDQEEAFLVTTWNVAS